MDFPLNTAFTPPHKFWCVVFSLFIYLKIFSHFLCKSPFFFFFFFFFWWGMRLQHTEVPRPGAEPAAQQWQNWSRSHWARPGIKPTTLWFLVRSVSSVPQWEFPCSLFFICHIFCHQFPHCFHLWLIFSSIPFLFPSFV